MATNATQMACVTLGYTEYLMPMSSAVRLVELMGKAVKCQKEYDGNRFKYLFGEPVSVELASILMKDIVMPEGTSLQPVRKSTPRLLKGG